MAVAEHGREHPERSDGDLPIKAPDNALRSVGEWFAQVGTASLELPRGWFGRPYDNQHELTWSAVSSRKLLLELDGRILLIVTEPGEVEQHPDQLLIRDCAQVTLDWQGYESDTPHVDDHGTGTVRFSLPPGRKIANTKP